VTDVHAVDQIDAVAGVADILQIPAFLCRQTDLLCAAGRTGKPVLVKKGQFMAPADMRGAIAKIAACGNANVLLAERGTTFGYHNLVVDMRALVIMRALGVPVVFDATHSVQLPGSLTDATGGERGFIPPLARAAAAAGIDALFLEVHDQPDLAPCDGPNMLPLSDLPVLLDQVRAVDAATRKAR
jgi:2-dehydro-3-deoxyphosphooctonate aldolase (KDO 8-P synthase)